MLNNLKVNTQEVAPVLYFVLIIVVFGVTQKRVGKGYTLGTELKDLVSK